MAAKIKALRAFMFAGRRIEPGEMIECDDQLAGELLSWRLAESADQATTARIRTRPVTEWNAAPEDTGRLRPRNWARHK